MKSNTDLKTSILETAEMLFADKGYEGTSVRDISDNAGINPAVIYYHFKSKDLLYKTLFNDRLSKMNEVLRKNQVDPAWSSLKKLNSYLALYIKKIREDFYFHRLLNSEIFSFRDLFFKMNIREAVSHNLTIFRQVIQEGIDQKEFRPIDIDLFLMTLFHLLHQVVGKSPLVSEILALEEFPEEETLDRIKGFLFYLLYRNDLQPAA